MKKGKEIKDPSKEVERFQPMRIQFSVAIALCRRDLQFGPYANPPTWTEFQEWSKRSGLFPEPLTREQCEYILAHPTECFGTGTGGK